MSGFSGPAGGQKVNGMIAMEAGTASWQGQSER